mgnify:CR=1 FL=1
MGTVVKFFNMSPCFLQFPVHVFMKRLYIMLCIKTSCHTALVSHHEKKPSSAAEPGRRFSGPGDPLHLIHGMDVTRIPVQHAVPVEENRFFFQYPPSWAADPFIKLSQIIWARGYAFPECAR